MNQNPTAEQKRFHDRLREMYFYTQMHNGVGELHHIFGSKYKAKALKEEGIERPGEWLVMMIPKKDHDAIDQFSFEAERGMFLEQQREYQKYFGEPSPVPQIVIDYFKTMKSKQDVVRFIEE